MHWLDDIITAIQREGARLAGGNPVKATHHDTAARVLGKLRDRDASHEEVRAVLLDTPAEPVAPQDPSTPIDPPASDSAPPA
jgi:hypothetical protein